MTTDQPVSPIDSGGVAGPVVGPVVSGGTRGVDEIRADLAVEVPSLDEIWERCRETPSPVERYNAVQDRLLADVPSLLAEVEAIKRDRARLIAELHISHAALAAVRGVVQAVEALRQRAADEITDASMGAAYAGEVDQGVLLASEQARSAAWQTVKRLCDDALAAVAVPTQDEPKWSTYGPTPLPTCEHGETKAHDYTDDGCGGTEFAWRQHCAGPVAASLPAPTETKEQR